MGPMKVWLMNPSIQAEAREVGAGHAGRTYYEIQALAAECGQRPDRSRGSSKQIIGSGKGPWAWLGVRGSWPYTGVP